jgi:mannobiose 2-epimerase
MNNATIKEELKTEYKNILEYWSKYSIDTQNDGFWGEVDNYGKPDKTADKGAVLNTRVLWTFASAYNFLKEDKYLKIAERAYNYLIKYFWDRDHKGIYWRISHKGEMLDGRKQTYAQGFAIYGLSEYYKATKNKEALNYAIELFNLIEQHCHDDKNGGYLEALSREWKKMDDMRLSLKDANEPKSMNTHLHIIEPYTNLYRVWPNEQLAERIKNLIHLFIDHIINTQTGHFHLFFDMDWTVKSNMESYGHDIEGTWLLCEAAEVLNDEALREETKKTALKMTNATISDGLAPDHSLFYEKDLTSNHLVKERHWWVQTEAMVGFTNAWQITGDSNYLDQMKSIWQYIDAHIIDKTNGEWHLRIGEDGKPICTDPKVGFWKCPYHSTRALMEIYNRLQ